MNDFSNPEDEIIFDLNYFKTQGVPGLLKDTATAILESGYYTLGDFFAGLTDLQLKALGSLIEGTASKNLYEQQVCYNGLFILTAVLLIGEGQQRTKVKHVVTALGNFASYVAYESVARLLVSPRDMHEKRKQYDLDKFYTTEGAT